MAFETLKHFFYRTMNKNMKRAKDNSGIGYSYGTAIATLANQKITSANNYKPQKSKDHSTLPQPLPMQPKEELLNSESVMKTAVINNDPLDDEVILGMVSVCLIIFLSVFVLFSMSIVNFYLITLLYNIISHFIIITT